LDPFISKKMIYEKFKHRGFRDIPSPAPAGRMVQGWLNKETNKRTIANKFYYWNCTSFKVLCCSSSGHVFFYSRNWPFSMQFFLNFNLFDLFFRKSTAIFSSFFKLRSTLLFTCCYCLFYDILYGHIPVYSIAS
jgi:hypothetical protein